jgi:hypothetical protein
MEDEVARPDTTGRPWWQKLLVALKLWYPAHRTLHHEVRDMKRPTPPPVTGAYGNRIVTSDRPRLVPQRDPHTN